jgi:hypothetical protein
MVGGEAHMMAEMDHGASLLLLRFGFELRLPGVSR